MTLAAAARGASNRGLLLAMAGLVAVSTGLQIARDRVWTPFTPAATVMWLHAGPIATRLALGYDNLLADLYWIRAVVYYGSQRLAAVEHKNYDLLSPMLALVTTLDPNFKVAYRFGAIFLTEAYPNGPGRPDQAIQLLERAIARHPDGWEYMYDTAFVYYWSLNDYRTAASWFERAAAVSGAPSWLKPLAATTLAQGGDRALSREMWRQLRDGSDQEWIRESAQTRLLQLDALDAIDALSGAIARYTAMTGKAPAAWADLVAARILRGVPLDPAGHPFVLAPETGAIDVSPESPLFPLPDKTRRGPQ